MQTKVNRNRKSHLNIAFGKMRFTVIRNESVLYLETKAVADLGHVTLKKTQKLFTNHSEGGTGFSFIHLGNLCSKGQELRPLSLIRLVSLWNVRVLNSLLEVLYTRLLQIELHHSIPKSVYC